VITTQDNVVIKVLLYTRQTLRSTSSICKQIKYC